MSYALYKLSEFTQNPLHENAQGENYYIEIYKKDYTGTHQNVIAAGLPALHSYQEDNYLGAIRGSSLDVTLLNKNGLCPLTDFFSDADDTFKVIFKWESQVLFTGYLVQDDCREDLIDATHEIQLKFTDNLGLLKDVTLDQAAALYGESVTTTEDLQTFYGSDSIIIGSLTNTVEANDTIIISGTGLVDGVYSARIVSIGSGGLTVTTRSIFGVSYSGTAEITIVTPVSLREKLPLSEFLRLCLLSTGLELNTKLYATIYPVGGSEDSFITASFLEAETFLSNKKWDDCYSVLQSIMERFNASVMQVEGNWVIIRQDERRYFDNLPGIEYNSAFEYVQDIELDNTFTAGIGEETRGKFVLSSAIQRSYRKVQETFMYSQPANLLKNIDFQDLGNLRTSYVIGDNTYYEYDMPDWYDGDTGNLGMWFITVVKNTIVGNEVDRYAVIDNSGVFPSVVKSSPVEVSAKDVLKISFDFRTTGSQIANGAEFNEFRFEVIHGLNPGTDYRRMDNQGNWNLSPYFKYYWTAGTNTNEWTTVEITSKELPFDGLFYFYLSQADFLNQDTYYRNIRFEVIRSINGSNKVIGQVHTDQQYKTIKNSKETDIKLDDSPSNAISGSLFLSSTSVLTRNRTTLWQSPALRLDYRLGEITTSETLFNHRTQRSKIEGDFRGLQQNSIHLSLLTLMRYSYFDGRNYAWGRCEIDYRNNTVSGVLTELYTDAEAARTLEDVVTGNTPISGIAPNTISILASSIGDVYKGDKIVIGTSAIAGTYTVVSYSEVGSNYEIVVAESVASMGFTSADFTKQRGYVSEDLLVDAYDFKYLYEKQ